MFAGKRSEVRWGTKFLDAEKADEGHYRISGVTGSGKSHLTKLFILEVLKELEQNPHAKLVLFEPQHEFYAWLLTLKAKYGLSSDVHYFFPSDKRSKGLDFSKDFITRNDALTLAHAFYPQRKGEHDPIWGNATRTVFASVYSSIKKKLGRCDLRLMCHVLGDPELTAAVLRGPDYPQARAMLEMTKEVEQPGGGKFAASVRATILSQTYPLTVLAAHLERCRKENGLISLENFVYGKNSGILAISRDEKYRHIQNPMNGTVFSRLVEIIDEERGDEDRKIFIVIDEFPTISGDDTPCPGMKAFFTRLRKRKTTLFLTYQGHSTVKSVYGDEAGGLVGQCHSAIYLRQPDDEQSAMEAEKSLGYKEREKTRGSTRGEKDVSRNVQEGYNKTPYCSATKLAQLPPASKEAGITGWLKSGARKEQEPHPFYIGPELVDNNIPITDKKLFKEYERRDGHEEEIAPLRDVERKTLMSDVPVVPPEFQDP